MLNQCDLVAFVLVTDTERAKAFYVDTLGLDFVSEDQFGVVVSAGGATIRITPIPDHVPSEHPVVGWEVPDMTSTVAAFAEKGIELLRYEGMGQDDRGVWTSPDGVQVAFFLDSEGNALSISQH